MTNLFIVAKNDEYYTIYKKRDFSIVRYIDNSCAEIIDGDNSRFLSIDISKLNNGDIIEINSDSSYYVMFNCESDDNAIVVTNKCNSNCIMCPCSEYWRKKPNIFDKEKIIKLISMINPSTKFLTLTGGEPTLIGRDFFDILDAIKLYLKDTKILILTNGRTLSNGNYFKELLNHLPTNARFGIPLYSNDCSLHDLITRSNNSLNETVIGIHNLINNNIETEIRIVPTAINNDKLNELCEYIAYNFYGIDCVNIMAMELTGSATINREKIWIDYYESFKNVKEGILRLINAGIDVRLYNFPLCKIELGYEFMSHKSISDFKIRYSEECDKCILKKECGGVFNSTLQITKMELKPYED